ncbi:hypothetical protein BC831DRAFT_434903 [Entophlyctis helioformis]|nr:hypothetical protein BC831DRAFT_434903 [Entophlyctis helioformis]
MSKTNSRRSRADVEALEPLLPVVQTQSSHGYSSGNAAVYGTAAPGTAAGAGSTSATSAGSLTGGPTSAPSVQQTVAYTGPSTGVGGVGANAAQGPGQPMNAAALAAMAAAAAAAGGKPAVQRMPKRTTKTSQKLTLFPEDMPGAVQASDFDALDDRDEIPQLPHVAAKTQKERLLTKMERKWLPRVTAFCTAGWVGIVVEAVDCLIVFHTDLQGIDMLWPRVWYLPWHSTRSYKMDALMEHLKRHSATYQTSPKRFDEVIYTPFNFGAAAAAAADGAPIKRRPGDLMHVVNEPQPAPVDGSRLLQSIVDEADSFFDQNIDAAGKSIPGNIPNESLAKRIAPTGEILYFDYGVVVMWGLTQLEEHWILDDLEKFEEERLEPDDIETEQFHFHYHAFFQPRIYNDIITLRNPANYMLKITISHAVAQSVKLTLFEGLIEETIESTKHVPQIMAEQGKIHMSRQAINKKIGQLFIMRINVNLVSNVLDTPEIFWSEPALEPLYMAIRGYLEISQRVELLNQRVAVISDLLDMLKEHLNSSHGEQLEWIVIILIASHNKTPHPRNLINMSTKSMRLALKIKLPHALSSAIGTTTASTATTVRLAASKAALKALSCEPSAPVRLTCRLRIRDATTSATASASSTFTTTAHLKPASKSAKSAKPTPTPTPAPAIAPSARSVVKTQRTGTNRLGNVWSSYRTGNYHYTNSDGSVYHGLPCDTGLYWPPVRHAGRRSRAHTHGIPPVTWPCSAAAGAVGGRAPLVLAPRSRRD